MVGTSKSKTVRGRNGEHLFQEFKHWNVPEHNGGAGDRFSSASTLSQNVSESYSTDEVTIVEYAKGRTTAPTDMKHLIVTIIISLLSWPVTYGLNRAFIKIDESERALWMGILGFAVMTFVIFLVLISTKIHDWLYYGFSLFAFTAVVDLIISLEYNGIIHGYMDQYLKLGETYLQSSWGNAIALFDAVGFYFMYLIMNYQMANRKSWRSTAIYWGSGILNSMIVFGLGIFCGSHSPTTCTLLNVPYIAFPLLVLIRTFQRTRPTEWVETVNRTFLSTMYDLGSSLILLTSIWLTLAKGLAVLGCNKEPIPFTVKEEKALHHQEPGPFAANQALLFLFYLIPLQLTSLYYHFKSTKPRFVWDLTLIQAGAVLQGQFAYIVYSFDQQLPEEIQVEKTNEIFWFANLIVLITPHLLLLGLLRHKWGRPLSAVERVLRKSE